MATEFNKQVSLFLPRKSWTLIRDQAARERIPITELVRRWIAPEIEKLRGQKSEED